ncbi:dienelactone hydrolase family protein [Streptomyces radicis]|uniref:Dienelactone hydrolase family protein n=1 Tax=Streptomyces radicis TaxID=1750517 RepID=A0A3A9WBR7_9ACTN|nr:dienelactone hydrolase family protein [Streptomyces radicis]RKN03457.1 dienelactone hydrolase family protein [Streptomyces radicis]RKN13319.1 dienelactone hydrolase family protein [Streptomyces radicis]
MGEQVEVRSADGGAFHMYVAIPERGSGPGLVLLQEALGVTEFMRATADRYAAEGYVVAVPDLDGRIEPEGALTDADLDRAMELYQQFDIERAVDDIAVTVAALRDRAEHVGGVGVIGYCLGGRLAVLAAARTKVDCAVGYYGVGITEHLEEMDRITVPVALHYGSEDTHCGHEVAAVQAVVDRHEHMSLWVYQRADRAFANDFRPYHDKVATDLAYTRTLSLVRGAIGPHFDLEAVWDLHLYHEFVTKDASAVLKTMVDDPYVNIAPTVMGGVGHDMLLRFYKYHFVDVHPDDTKMIPVSRTVGVNRIVQELVLCFTHDREIPYLLPEVAPTGRYMEIAMVAIVSFHGDMIYNEHIYFDQASVLVQAGLIDPEGLPVTGAEVARKVLDKDIEPNRLMPGWGASESLPLT